jgi:hypothetical protein
VDARVEVQESRSFRSAWRAGWRCRSVSTRARPLSSTARFEQGLGRLRSHLAVAEVTCGRAADPRRAARGRGPRSPAADGPDRSRILDEMAALRQQIGLQREAVGGTRAA